MTTSQKWWLLIPAFVCFVVDVAITMVGQPDNYWNGDYSAAVEWNPIGRIVLVEGPNFFAAMAIVWMLLVGIIVLLWNHRLAEWIPIVIAVSHAVGGASWMTRMHDWGWIVAIAYLVVASQVSRWCWKQAGGIAPA